MSNIAALTLVYFSVCHAFLFVAIVVNSFCTAYTFHKIFYSYKFECILFSRPHFRLTDIKYHPTKARPLDNLVSTVNPLDGQASNVTTTTPVPMKTEVKDDKYYVSNVTLSATVMLDYIDTTYGKRDVCNSILFVPLMTLVVGTFATIMTIICGKGGGGYKSDM